jgi:hypothetical protein
MSISISYNGIINNEFPFPFLQNFADFINNQPLKKFILFYDQKGNSIPAILSKSSFLKVLQFQFSPIDKYSKQLSINDENLFLDELVSFITREKLCDKIIQGANHALFKTFPKKSIHVPFGSYKMNLKNSLEELFNNLHGKNRNVIKNAQRKGIKILYGRKVLIDFYFLYEKTTKRSNMYCEEINYFKKLYDCLGANIVCSVCYHGNEPLGGLFMIYTNYCGFYLYGASSDKTTINGAINYLQWEMISLLKSKGVKMYDFVGARLSDVEGTRLGGIQKFKQRFGSRLEKGYLWKIEINRTKCFLHKILLKIKLKLKGVPFPTDIIDQEIKAFKQKPIQMK